MNRLGDFWRRLPGWATDAVAVLVAAVDAALYYSDDEGALAIGSFLVSRHWVYR